MYIYIYILASYLALRECFRYTYLGELFTHVYLYYYYYLLLLWESKKQVVVQIYTCVNISSFWCLWHGFEYTHRHWRTIHWKPVMTQFFADEHHPTQLMSGFTLVTLSCTKIGPLMITRPLKDIGPVAT
jgi:hypothetical protein